MSCALEKGKCLLVIKHMSVPEDNRTQLLTKEIHDCYRPSGTVRTTTLSYIPLLTSSAGVLMMFLFRSLILRHLPSLFLRNIV